MNGAYETQNAPQNVSENRGLVKRQLLQGTKKSFLLKFVFVFISLLFLNPGILKSQDQNERIYIAYISGEMGDWLVAMNEIEDSWENTGSMQTLYELVVAQYGYIAFLIAEKQKKEARVYVKKAEANIELLIEYKEDWARAHAMLGAIYGFKVGLDPYKAPVLGLRSFDENKYAFELAPEDPQVWMEKANIELYKPSVFGNNAPEAAEMYAKAAELFEKDIEGLKHNWLYLNTLSGQATAHIKAGQYKKANATYQKLLKFEPNFKWIRDEVYPEFRKKYAF